MFPLTVSYAMTIHKSQSLSLDCVFADLGKDVFCPGMAYVALSRCRSHKGLHLLNFCPTKVYASGKACVEYSRLQKKADFFSTNRRKSLHKNDSGIQTKQNSKLKRLFEMRSGNNKELPGLAMSLVPSPILGVKYTLMIK